MSSRAQSDFVHDYAAKRAAQMERAKALRDQRKADGGGSGGSSGQVRGGGNQTPPLGAGHYNNHQQQQQQQQQYQHQQPNPHAPQQQQQYSIQQSRQQDGNGSGGYGSGSHSSGSYEMPGAVGRQGSDYQPHSQYQQPQHRQQPQHHNPHQSDYPPPLTQTKTPSKSTALSRPREREQPPPPQQSQGGTDSVEVSESDFQRAVAMGIISADQARQLWSTLNSNNPPPPAMTMGYGGTQQPKSYTTLENKQGGGSSYQASRFNAQYEDDGVDEQEHDDYEEEVVVTRKAPPAKSSSKKKAKPEWNTEPDPVYEDEREPEPVVQRRPAKTAAKKQPVVQHREWNTDTDENALYNNPAPVAEKKKTTAVRRSQQLEETKSITPLSLQPQQGGAPKSGSRVSGQRPTRQQQLEEPPQQYGGGGGDSEVAEMERQKMEAAARFEAELNEAPSNEPMATCNICDRTFRRSILTKHEAACLKANKKRKAFDVAGQRADGVEGLKEAQQVAKTEAKFAPKAKAGAVSNAKIPKWKLQSAQLQQAMQAGRHSGDSTGGGAAVGGGGGGARMQVPIDTDDRVPCPHCGRKFNTDVADRHIPKCKTTQAKPTMLLRKK